MEPNICIIREKGNFPPFHLVLLSLKAYEKFNYPFPNSICFPRM
jgi:hypothetical protein